ncbi:eukaryotic translation initiation factor 3 subunit G-domain-containing protein [Leucosporidium creatinivorum]|uniref:Eukaryotic translation initiation factor 3 subunit G n=1 Tax=Leucosporidium creatinivorum TaxID=106004 RepID=A0A1Y2ENG3_9BASI|nr:eukaryotic translation initiation factor 3 subunit G-domain-containing protein [Leucosporidium creatinivorum]
MPALQSWADDVESHDFPPRTETTDKDGITTIVEYKLNDEGKKVKVTRKIKRTLVKSKVNHVVAERMGWTKFGAEKGHKAGPDTATTTVGENVRLKLTAGGIKKDEPEEDSHSALQAQLAGRKITCRLCQGDHYTTRCPYKDTLGEVLGGEDNPDAETSGAGALGDNPTPSEMRAAGGKYVPPSMRAGAKGAGESMNNKNRDDLPTLRVTNLSEDCTDSDLWDLFQRFGRINRIYVGKDQETGLCKGFAFVSFESRAEAEKAMGKINGLPYDHLILACSWSVPKGTVEAK